MFKSSPLHNNKLRKEFLFYPGRKCWEHFREDLKDEGRTSRVTMTCYVACYVTRMLAEEGPLELFKLNH